MIQISEAGVRFRDFSLGPVSLELPKGYIIGVQGENGAGKTTFLKMMMGCYPSMKGSVTVSGFDVVRERERVLSKLGVVVEDRRFFEEEDAIRNEEYFSVFYEGWDRERYRDMLAKPGISPGRKIGTLSKGERVMYQMAFLSAYRPAVILLDEPTAGLDVVFRQEFLRILQDFVAEYEATVILATHIEEDVSRIADYVIEVEGGVCTMREVAAYEDGF